MNSFPEFNIPFAGLPQGIHSYSFRVGTNFFEKRESSDIKTAEIDLSFNLHKQSAVLTLGFKLKGWVELMCDRCADYFTLPVDDLQTLYVKFGESNHEESDEIIVLSETEYEINIAHYVYEFIHLALPLKRAHAEGECNNDIINQLDNFSSQDQAIDPRWEALGELKK